MTTAKQKAASKIRAAKKKAKEDKRKAKAAKAKAKAKAKQIVQIQLYMSPADVRRIARDRKRRESEIRGLLGSARFVVSRSSHCCAVIDQFLVLRAKFSALGWHEFWAAAEAGCKAAASKAAKATG